MQGHHDIRYRDDSSKVTGVCRTSRDEGDVVEAIFFVTAVLLRSTIDLVMIVLVFGSALLVVLSKKKFDR